MKKPAPKSAKAAKLTPANKETAKANIAALLDVSDITLPGEDKLSVPVYDTCDELRKKLRPFLAKDGMTNAAFAREISKTSTSDEINVTGTTLSRFMGLKGPLNGNTTRAFYAAYVFMEKRRIKDGKDKSAFRNEMEKIHRFKGVDLEHNSNTGFLVFAGEKVSMNKYGQINVY